MVELHLAVALQGAGWHPAAWRLSWASPGDLTSARYWVDLVQEAERGLVDFVTFEDAMSLQSSSDVGPDDHTNEVRGHLDAVLVAARVAPLTSRIGLVPAATVTHTEPFHLSKAIATLDHVSNGRGGWRAQVSGRPDEAKHFGRRERPTLSPPDLVDEAGDFVEVVRRLWDSWEDDAEIRDAQTGRFVDREKLHYVDFEGRWFEVRGPSITPRPPQGQPVVVALSHTEPDVRFAAHSTDVVLVAPRDQAEATGLVSQVRGAQREAGRSEESVHVFGDLVVFLERTPGIARLRRERMDDLAGTAFTSDAEIFVGTAVELVDLLVERQQAGLTGFRLRPASLPHDLLAITQQVVPELQRRHLFRSRYPEARPHDSSLRGLLGLPRPANRYAALPGGTS